MRLASTFLLAGLALAAAPCARADYFVVVNEHSTVQALSQKEVLHLFMGRTRAFPNGDAAVAYDIGVAAQREGFYRSLSGMNLPQLTSYWARLMFSGRSLPPQQLEGAAAMIEQVRKDSRAIGWLPEAPIQKGLRTVLVIRDAP